MMEIKFNRGINIPLVGSSSAGRSILASVFFGGEFTSTYLSTIGIDKLETRMRMNDGKEVKIIFYDTPGQERFRSLALKTFRIADGMAIFFDVTSKNSFEDVENWLELTRKNCNNVPILLVGCKCDLIERREIVKDDVEQYAKDNNISYIETSAKLNINVKEAFEKIANDSYENSYKNMLLEKKKKDKKSKINDKIHKDKKLVFKEDEYKDKDLYIFNFKKEILISFF